MDYNYETLGDDRFQQLCQSILAYALPNVQCFPINQRDGGRDAIMYRHTSHEANSFEVFQVKYVKRPYADVDPHKWLTSIVEAEAPKVKELIPRGATAYHLLTNVPGTSYLDKGSIDQVQTILNTQLGIPAQCWWRDDLNRRLDFAWDVKWAYPEILRGGDVLRYLVEHGLQEDASRRTQAIRAFVRGQYVRELEVRFKQVELQNNLLDLFIDVPIVLRRLRGERQNHTIAALFHSGRDRDEHDSFGAAALMLHPLVQKEVNQLVLEGAPGQGKSTLSQFVCQVYRMYILGEDSSLQRVDELLRPTSLRLPIKADLRDVATWIGGQDPFSQEHPSKPTDWERSLESFLAALIRYHSGGIQFTVSDLHSVAKVSALLLVLDGLDEVADISKRRELVREVTIGIERLRINAASLQVVVTSRPAAFANSPGFSDKSFPHFTLAALSTRQIDEYADKWIAAKNLQGRDASGIRRILRTKLEQPHLRDLARNPMQLTILLGLIHTRGESLPDKRTALYDSYVDLFFDREAEKSATVRDNRELLIDIHRYLGWLLHAEAEEGRENGAVPVDRLRELISEYLESQGHDASLVTDLFSGVVERIVFLVSRLQGSLEFEVQPLREYFAGRHLYLTAPYSPPGGERRGTKPDRFHALARNSYWLNVTRFYAGCYSKGELPSLVDGLKELLDDSEYRYISVAHLVAAMLLSDWVFAQHPRSRREAVRLVVSGLGMRYVLASPARPGRRRLSEALTLPKDCGQDELVDECFQLLRGNPARDYALELTDLLRMNGTKQNLMERWSDEARVMETTRLPAWFEIGLRMGVLSQVGEDVLISLLDRAEESPEAMASFLNSGRSEVLARTDARCETVVSLAVSGDLTVSIGRRDRSMLTRFVQAIDPVRYAIASHFRGGPSPLMTGFPIFRPTDEGVDDSMGRDDADVLRHCRRVVEVADHEVEKSSSEWMSDVGPWEHIAETVRAVWGEQWSMCHFANIASAFGSREKYSDGEYLFDSSTPICRRARYARSRSAVPSYWRRHFANAADEWKEMFTALTFLSWAARSTFMEMIGEINAVTAHLSQSSWAKVYKALEVAVGLPTATGGVRSLRFDAADLPEGISPRLVVAMSLRSRREASSSLYQRFLPDYDGDDPTVLGFCQREAQYLVTTRPAHWGHLLSVISRIYSRGITSYSPEYYSPNYLFFRDESSELPLSVSKEILARPGSYPRDLVIFADDRCRQDVQSRSSKVGAIARAEGWFDDL